MRLSNCFYQTALILVFVENIKDEFLLNCYILLKIKQLCFLAFTSVAVYVKIDIWKIWLKTLFFKMEKITEYHLNSGVRLILGRFL